MDYNNLRLCRDIAPGANLTLRLLIVKLVDWISSASNDGDIIPNKWELIKKRINRINLFKDVTAKMPTPDQIAEA